MSTRDKEHPPLPRPVADQLLQLLGSDDAFRELFATDVTSAMALLGYEPAYGRVKSGRPPGPGELLRCMTVAQLASKEEILQAREQLRSYLTSRGNHSVVFCLESGKMHEVLQLRSTATPRDADAAAATRPEAPMQP